MRKPYADSEALVIAPEAPFPAIGGGPLRTASLIYYLARRGPVDVIAFHEPGQPDPAAAFPPGLVRRVDVIQLPRHSRSAAARAIRNLRRAARNVPPLIDRFGGFRLPLSRRYTLALIEHIWCAPYLEQVAAVSDRVALDLHNLEWVLHAHRAEDVGWLRARLHNRFSANYRDIEGRLLPRFDTVLVPSGSDADRTGLPAIVYPNAIPETPQPDVAEQDLIAFSGNFAYDPNLAAIRWFARHVWPAVRQRHTRLRWRLIGKNPPAIRDPRVETTGPLADAVQELARAKVVVVPIHVGSGTRLKIVEAWAAGRAVVSTTRGAEGLPAAPEENIVIADTPADFTREVVALLESPARRARLGRAGRATYESQLTWPAAWACLERVGFYSPPATPAIYTG